ncbi:MAG: hypothetical protein JWN86_1074 [Planctomycetota bacterium]|nr:hypothetical protein [Planctomycetota bacterium]
MENRIRKYFGRDDSVPFPVQHEDLRLAVQDSISFLGTTGTLEERAYHFDPTDGNIPEHYLYHFYPSEGSRVVCDVSNLTESLPDTDHSEDGQRVQVHGPGDGFPAYIEIQGVDADIAYEVHIYTGPLPLWG